MILGKKNPSHSSFSQLKKREDYPCRAAMCAEIIDQIKHSNLINNVPLRNGVTFPRCGRLIIIIVAFGEARSQLNFWSVKGLHQK